MWIIRPKRWNRPEAGEVCSCCGRRMPASNGARKLARPRKADPLMDTRITAELYLAGIDPRPRLKAEKRAIKKGKSYRTILVRLADGFECVAGSYMASDDHAKAAAVRFARARAMEVEFARRLQAWKDHCRDETRRLWEAGKSPSTFSPPAFDRGFRWVSVPGAGYSVSVRACDVAEVASVEFIHDAHHERKAA